MLSTLLYIPRILHLQKELLHRPNSSWRVTGIFESDDEYSGHMDLVPKALDADEAQKLSKVVVTMEEIVDE